MGIQCMCYENRKMEALAATGSWTGAHDWLNALVPDFSATANNAGVAPFSISPIQTSAVTVDADRNINGIVFSNTAAFGCILAAGALRMVDGARS